MCNIFYSCFDQNKILCRKQHHALVEIVDSIFELFIKRKHAIGIFVSLSKAFDMVDYDISIKNSNFMVFKETI